MTAGPSFANSPPSKISISWICGPFRSERIGEIIVQDLAEIGFEASFTLKLAPITFFPSQDGSQLPHELIFAALMDRAEM